MSGTVLIPPWRTLAVLSCTVFPAFNITELSQPDCGQTPDRRGRWELMDSSAT